MEDIVCTTLCLASFSWCDVCEILPSCYIINAVFVLLLSNSPLYVGGRVYLSIHLLVNTYSLMGVASFDEERVSLHIQGVGLLDYQ